MPHTSSDPHVFGYGSLVNRTTHAYAPAHPATLHGFRRTWRTTGRRAAAFLTATPAPGHTIAGLIAAVSGADWSALDAREAGYERLPAPRVDHPLPGAPAIAVYAIPNAATTDGLPCPILLSYLDVVIQGYAVEFGAAGVDRFVATTDGWDAPVADDRKAPLYPRARTLTPDQTAMVNAVLHRMRATIIAPDHPDFPKALRRPAP